MKMETSRVFISTAVETSENLQLMRKNECCNANYYNCAKYKVHFSLTIQNRKQPRGGSPRDFEIGEIMCSD